MIWRSVRLDGVVFGSSGNLRRVSSDLVLQIGQVCIDLFERSNLALDHLVRDSAVSSSRKVCLCLRLHIPEHFLIAGR
jgi:hypothetical protein